MILIASAFLCVFVPALGALRLCRRERCSVWWLITAPVVGLFVFCVLVLLFVFISGDV